MKKKIFVVTGANKGIGYGIVRTLTRQLSDAIVYLTARNSQLGEASVKKVVEELSAERKAEVVFHQLDITDEQSCQRFADHLRSSHGQIDVLINNAGFAFSNDAKEPAIVQAQITIDINYYGTKRVSRHLQPLIRDGGRVVNVCSSIGRVCPFESSSGRRFAGYSDDWARLLSSPDVTEKQIDEFVKEYKRACEPDDRKARGFPESAYRVSKSAEIAYTILQSRQLAARNIIVNACCPGYVNTDMSNHNGLLTIDEGADTPAYLATAADVPRGEFVYRREVVPWFLKFGSTIDRRFLFP